MAVQIFINGVVTGSIYAVVALGFALIYNTTRIFHIAYAVLYMIPAYIVFSFYTTLGYNLLLSIFLAILFTSLLSFLMEFIVYKPLERNNSSLNVILVSSIGIMIIIINIIAIVYGTAPLIVRPEIASSFTLGDVIITENQVIQFFIAVVTLIFFIVYLKYSRFGIITRALRDDVVLFKLMGLSKQKTRYQLFLLSGVFAAIGGILVAIDVGVDPYVGMPMLLNVIVALIIGGIGRFEAPIVGGFLIGLLQSLSNWLFSAQWQNGVTFLLLILFLLIRPHGLFGEKERVV